MASVMDATFTVELELRPCLVDGRFKAMWHTWAQRSYRGNNGEMAVTVAVVEYEDGGVDYVLPTRVRFLDTRDKMHELDIFFHTEERRGLIKKEE